MSGWLVRIRGAVQGVGFRPTVARLARARGLNGWVKNDGDGVLLGLACARPDCDALLADLQSDLPPLARVDAVEVEPATIDAAAFTIDASGAGPAHTEVVPDATTCAACLGEVLDPAARRHRYPFTNCTHCGPRYTIVTGVPYDRPNTTMDPFPMCAHCAAEYADEADRRYHAQPIACPACGPRVRLISAPEASPAPGGVDDVDRLAACVAAGEVVAVKGLGSFHLICDATQPAAVRALRERKRRPHKPFALMAASLDMVRRHARVTEAEARVLGSPEAPIVLLDALDGTDLAPEVAPGARSLGFMLPHTPLHHLLFTRLDRPMVCTSANLTEEPPCTADDEARARLAGIADRILTHDRVIRNRAEDSVVRRMDGRMQVWRRARGYAPRRLPWPPGFGRPEPLLAVGGDLKAAFALADGDGVLLSPYLGDLAHAAAFDGWQDALHLTSALFDHHPARVAVDGHPGYHSHRAGRALAEARGLPVLEIGHHHAHVAACQLEHGAPLDAPPVLGIALDGLGLGPDGQLWGGELLAATFTDAERLAHLAPVPLLGGDAASREPWRNLYAHLVAQLGWAELEADFADVPAVRRLAERPRALLDRMIETGTRAPPASSAGRLFDAAAAALGLFAERIDYEGQAAVALEALVEPSEIGSEAPYPMAIEAPPKGPLILRPAPLWRALLGDLRAEVPPARIAARFHLGLAAGVADLAAQVRAGHPELEIAVLSGGVWQNRTLLEACRPRLEAAGFAVRIHERLPPGDGCLAVGQAAIAAARLRAAA